MKTEAKRAMALYRKEDRRDFIPAAVLSAAVHALLVFGLFSVVQWSTSTEEVYAELWAPEEVSGGYDPEGVAEKRPVAETPRDETSPEEATDSVPAQSEPELKPELEPAAPPEPRPTPEELAKLEAERQSAEEAEARRVETERIAQQVREEVEARRAENERLAQERARAEEIERAREEAIEAERQRQLEEAQRLEEERLAQERLAEETRKAEEARLAQEAQRLEEERLAEETRQAEEARKAEEARLAEELRLAEEAKKAEEARIAAEKAEEEERMREEAEAKAEAERIAAEMKAEEERRVAEEKRKAEEKKKKEAEEAAERKRIATTMRQQELARLSAKVTPNATHSGTPTGSKSAFKRSLRGSALVRYSSRVAACVRQYITIEVPTNVVRKQFEAIYRVKLLPTGEQVGGPVQEKASGWAAYDLAVERAIRQCNPFPRPDTGEDVPNEITLSFDPVEDRK